MANDGVYKANASYCSLKGIFGSQAAFSPHIVELWMLIVGAFSMVLMQQNQS
jgi:hypothetical protein